MGKLVFSADAQGLALRSTRGAQLSLKRSPARLPTNYRTTGTWNYGCPHWLEQVSSRASEIGSRIHLPASAGHDRRTPCVLIESLRMQKRSFFRWILPAILGLLVGFLALAWAITSESTLPVSLVFLFSPGLKVAELVMPAAHESLAWTFGWFLRIAISVNAMFYFAVFALLSYLVDGRRSENS
jgi:hypothetical protein